MPLLLVELPGETVVVGAVSVLSIYEALFFRRVRAFIVATSLAFVGDIVSPAY
jgi:hypothetical protein